MTPRKPKTAERVVCEPPLSMNNKAMAWKFRYGPFARWEFSRREAVAFKKKAEEFIAREIRAALAAERAGRKKGKR